ncbi:alpha-galactosidase, partial [bacterium]|nr:alpha-galactosidase [bacterium]
DIVYSLCQYGMGNVSAWGADVGGNCWRTTGDITDTWGSMAGIGFAQGALSEYAGPGRWNDPDMLVVGHVGWGAKTRPCRLTRNEQYTHISLWCLLASPLLLGCDLGTLDEFTRSLLTNHEVLDVNQDELGRQATRVWRSGHIEAWAKAMADGSLAVGVFNLDHFGARGVVVPLEPLGCKGRQRARDLWRQKSLGTLSGKLVTDVPGHGVVLLKLSAAPSGTASAE